MTVYCLTNGIDCDGRRIDVEIVDGLITRIVDGTPSHARGRTFDLEGRLVLPALIDGHLHLDKTFLGMPWQPHSAGPTVMERIENEVRLQANMTEPVGDRAGRLAQRCIANGTLAIRTHVDIDETKRLKHLHAVLEVRERFSRFLDVEIVAFPQSGVMRQPQVADLLKQAIAEGANVVGGLDPATVDEDMDGQLNVIFGLAERQGVGVDVHLHNTGQIGIREVDAIIARTVSMGLQNKVTLSHAYVLGSVPQDICKDLAERLADARIAVMTASPGAVALPPLELLRDAGVNVFAGSDNVRDAWSPFGNADMLERLMLIAYRSGYRRDEEIEGVFEYATRAPARVLGIDPYGLEPGARADLIALDSRCLAEAIITRPSARLVFRSGRLIARDGCLVGMSRETDP